MIVRLVIGCRSQELNSSVIQQQVAKFPWQVTQVKKLAISRLEPRILLIM